MSQPSKKTFGVIVEIINDHRTITEDFLKDTFGKFGEVKSVKISNSKKGYVNFSKKEDAEMAVNSLNHTNLRDLKVTLQTIDFRALTDCQYKEKCAKKDVCFLHCFYFPKRIFTQLSTFQVDSIVMLNCSRS